VARRSKKTSELTASGARDRALRALSRREHSAAELRHKLEHRGLGEQAAERIVDDLAKSGWQSDARYAEMLVRSRIAQGYGPLRVEAELEHARVSPAEISAAIEAAEADWAGLATHLQARKFGSLPKKPADWQKQYRYLAGRGFAPEQIHVALKGELPE